MANNRMERIKEEYKRELASIFREIKDPRLSMMTSVVSVEITKDLKYAKVYVSVMGSDDEKKNSISALKSATGFIKREIGSRLKLRAVPQPTFVLDTSIDYGAHINSLISKISKDKELNDDE